MRAITKPMAPTRPAPKTAGVRGAAAPVKMGAAGVVEEPAALEVMLSQVVLLAETGATGVEEVVTLMKLGDGVEEDLPQAEELVATGFTGVVDEEDEVEFAEYGPQDDEEELVATG